MAKKTVIITINHPPYSGNLCEEALRTVVGTHLAVDDQIVKTVFLGDGIYFGLKDLKQQDFLKYLKTIKSMKMDIFLEEESIKERKIDKEMLHKDFKVIPRSEILAFLKEADHVMAF